MSIHDLANRNHNTGWTVGDLAHWLLIVTLSTLKWMVIVLIAFTVAILVMVSIVWGPTPLYLSLPSAGL